METTNALSLLLAKLQLLLISVAFAQATYSVQPMVGIPDPAIAQNLAFATSTLLNSPPWVEAYVRMKAKAAGVNPALAACIVSHESQFSDRNGDDGNSRGWWQISKIWHPEVSDACAHDLTCSTDWSLDWISKGHIAQWSTWKLYCH